jgi:hypothetical protein
LDERMVGGGYERLRQSGGQGVVCCIHAYKNR